MTGGIIIVSGGQTGVDRGALDAALDLGVPCGGWCPEGRRAEDGAIPERYPLQVLPGAGYRQRTRQNVRDSDATVIIHFGGIVSNSGTAHTVDDCERVGKPHIIIDGEVMSVVAAAEALLGFVQSGGFGRLNVAGPRGAGVPQAHGYTQGVIHAFLCRFLAAASTEAPA